MVKKVMTEKELEKNPQLEEQPDMEEKTGNKTEKKSLFDQLKFKSILHKMIASFAAVILFTVIIILVSVFASTQARTSTNEVIQDQLPAMLNTQELVDNYKDRSQVIYEYIADGNEQRATEFEALTETAAELEAEVLEHSSNDDMIQAVDLSQQWTEAIRIDVINPMLSGNGLIANANMKKLKPMRDMILRIYNENILAVQDEVETSGQSVIQSQDLTLIIIVVLGVIAVVLSIFISLQAARSITNPIREMNTRLDAISNEDFTMEPLEIETEDEMGQLAHSLNVTQDKLKNTMNNITSAVDLLIRSSHEFTRIGQEAQEGTRQIGSTMHELASGAESEAHIANDLTVEMTRFEETTTDTLEYGQEIKKESEDIREQAQNGTTLVGMSTKQMQSVNEIVERSVLQMEKLNKQTAEISKLIDIIQSIAKQTNLLALNASIEAARAGEHGRGFAVVAEEVRQLAEGVAESVNEITSYVQSVQDEADNVTKSLQDAHTAVDEGTVQIQSADENIAEITRSINELEKRNEEMVNNLSDIKNQSHSMHSLIEEIASLSEESAAGVEETVASVDQINLTMDGVGNQSQELETLANNLGAIIRSVKV